MKKTKAIMALALMSFAVLGVASCSSGDITDSSSIGVKEFSLSAKNVDLIYGDTYELVAKSTSKDPIVWESSDEEVAKVNDGTVLACGKGSAVITAKSGSLSATCLVNVGFSNILPALTIDNVSDNNVFLAKGSSFALRGLVSFNGKTFPCPISVALEDDGVLSLSDGFIVGAKEGTTEVRIKGNWNGFSNNEMGKTIQVNVSKDVSFYTEVSFGASSFVTSKVELSIVPSWQGKNYNSEATLSFKTVINGSTQLGNVVLEDNDIVSLSEDGRIKAKKTGSTKVYGNYVDKDGTVYTTFVNVEVTCPVANYDGQLRISSESPFPLDAYFGEGASLTYAKQGDKELPFTSNGLIKGLSAKGAESDPLLILTSKGGFYFENSFVYTKVLDASNFSSTFTLSPGKIIDGYYILDEDILTTIDMSAQARSYYSAGSEKNTYFKGTFDGQGHTLKARVGREGIFGGIGEQCVIKNTHFEFTFNSKDSYCSGLAGNNMVTSPVITGWKVSLSNLYVTTTNYFDKSYALFEMRFNDMTMNDIYVDLTLDESCKEVEAAAQEKGALFRIDNTITSGPYGQFYGDFQNIYVVSGVLMPISSAKYDAKNTFVSYAKNDIDRLGTYEIGGIAEQVMHCVLGSKVDNEKKALFGSLPGATWFFGASKNTDLAWVYFSLPTITNGGISRFDTKEDLLNANISKIGSWNVEGE